MARWHHIFSLPVGPIGSYCCDSVLRFHDMRSRYKMELAQLVRGPEAHADLSLFELCSCLLPSRCPFPSGLVFSSSPSALTSLVPGGITVRFGADHGGAVVGERYGEAAEAAGATRGSLISRASDVGGAAAIGGLVVEKRPE